MNPITYPNGANTGNVTGTDYVAIGGGRNGGTPPPYSPAPAGMLINDIAIDPDTGDAYFTDSFNCREISHILSRHKIAQLNIFRHHEGDHGTFRRIVRRYGFCLVRTARQCFTAA